MIDITASIDKDKIKQSFNSHCGGSAPFLMRGIFLEVGDSARLFLRTSSSRPFLLVQGVETAGRRTSVNCQELQMRQLGSFTA